MEISSADRLGMLVHFLYQEDKFNTLSLKCEINRSDKM